MSFAARALPFREFRDGYRIDFPGPDPNWLPPRAWRKTPPLNHAFVPPSTVRLAPVI